MSRPLEQIRKETRAANRSHHLRKTSQPDQIDILDDIGIGGAYHHDGPYEATLASRNRNKKYAPVEAVKEGNMMALKATPQENIQDSLRKHVPLQGTATIPPGETDMFGRRLSYEEGADLMREPDAPGGAYKRYDHIQYHPEDYKGKGEPNFTIDREMKKRSAASSGSAYEMQPTGKGGRHRSTSSAAHHGVSSSQYLSTPRTVDAGDEEGMQRSHSTGKRMEGLKRRLGSLRHRRVET